MSVKEYLMIDEKFLSTAERRIHKYLCENLSSVENMTIYELTDETYVSRATIDRYLKKCNINGFKHLKILLSQEELVKDNTQVKNLAKYIFNNPKAQIAIVGKGTSHMSAEYLSRRLQTLGYFVHSYTYDSVIVFKDNIDLVIFVSSRGGIFSDVDREVINSFKCTTYAITAPDSKLSEIVTHTISNNKRVKQSRFERENILPTIEVMENLVEILITLG